MRRTKRRSACARPFELTLGVPAALIRALDSGAALASEWCVPTRVVIYSAREGGALVTLGEASDYGAALQLVLDALRLHESGGGDPRWYPMASSEILALIAELTSPVLRELCLMIENTLSVVWPDELFASAYLSGIEDAFPAERLVIGWEATGPMVDFAWAFLAQR